MQHDPQRWQSDYERQGYLVVEDVLDAAQLNTLRASMDRLARERDKLPAHLQQHIQMERDYVKAQPHYNDLTAEQVGDALRNVMELPLFGPEFAELIFLDPLLDVLEATFHSKEFHFHNYKAIVKAPRVSSVFRWHRDLPYLEHSTSNLITAMLCIDEMTAANGATVVLPGTHRIPDEQVSKEDMDIPDDRLPADVPRVTVICPAGSAVLFHVNIIHGGGANRSETPRRNLIGIWAGPHTYPVTAARYAYQDLYPRSADPARQKQVRKTRAWIKTHKIE